MVAASRKVELSGILLKTSIGIGSKGRAEHPKNPKIGGKGLEKKDSHLISKECNLNHVDNFG